MKNCCHIHLKTFVMIKGSSGAGDVAFFKNIKLNYFFLYAHTVQFTTKTN
jgi:hypothetical protein